MDKLSKIDKQLLSEIADLHSIPQGSYNIRKDGELYSRNSTEDVEIKQKKNTDGIDIVVNNNIKNRRVHIPVPICGTEADVSRIPRKPFPL